MDANSVYVIRSIHRVRQCGVLAFGVVPGIRTVQFALAQLCHVFIAVMVGIQRAGRMRPPRSSAQLPYSGTRAYTRPGPFGFRQNAPERVLHLLGRRLLERALPGAIGDDDFRKSDWELCCSLSFSSRSRRLLTRWSTALPSRCPSRTHGCPIPWAGPKWRRPPPSTAEAARIPLDCSSRRLARHRR